MFHRFILAAAFAAVTLPATASPITDFFTSFLVVGDSLSDPGNAYAVTQASPDIPVTPPVPPYFAGGTSSAGYVFRPGQFSNGPTWADLVSANFFAAGKPSFNVAFGGARAITDNSSARAALIPDMLEQIAFAGALSAGQLGDRPLGAAWFGGNDLFALIGSTTIDVKMAARDIADQLVANLAPLIGLGIDDIVVPNVPLLGDIPRYALTGDPALVQRANDAADAFNSQLELGLGAVPANVYQIDIADLFETVGDRPGITQTVLPCLSQNLVPCGDPSEFVFWDLEHPTGTVHGIIADETTEQVYATVIPLPLGGPMLVGGLMLLAPLALFRRHAAR